MEIALIDLRDEATFALGHPLFAAQIPAPRLAVEAPFVIPRRDCLVAIYDDGEGLIEKAAQELTELGYTQVRTLAGGLSAWRDAGLELFQDVNSYSKAFGELVESTRHTPSLPPEQVKALIDSGERMVILDARRFDEYATMAIPDAVSVPGAELVLRARSLAPDPSTRIIVNCAGRTRSLIGTQSLINAGIPNPVYALRNGTIGWTLAGQQLALGQSSSFEAAPPEKVSQARNAARTVAYRAGVRQIDSATMHDLSRDHCRTLYCFDVRSEREYREGHLPQFRHAPGGQLVQEIDIFAPVRGARIVLADALGVRSEMTASWLAQMGWEVYVLTPDVSSGLAEGISASPPPRGPEGRYKRPYEGTDNPVAAMQAYLEWEYGLVDQLERDGSHGFFVI
jgi:rhodanese-related sulfurtransferase